MATLSAVQLKNRAEKYFPGILAGDDKSFSNFYDAGLKSLGRTEDDAELDFAGLHSLFATNSRRFADQQLIFGTVSLENGRYTVGWSWAAWDNESGGPVTVTGHTVVSELSAKGKVRREETVYISRTSEVAGDASLGAAATFQPLAATPRDPGSLASATPRDPGSGAT